MELQACLAAWHPLAVVPGLATERSMKEGSSLIDLTIILEKCKGW